MKKYLSILLLGAASCTIAPNISVTLPENTASIYVPGKLFATIYQQRSAEYKALCYQTFNLAKLRLDQFTQGTTSKPFAIMTDVDETVLSNAAYQAHQTLQNKDYESDSWYAWTAMANADTVPGALHFLQYAHSKGVKVFYVTNRAEKERAGTLKNLQKFNFPDATNDQLLLKQDVSTKEVRKQKILERYNLVLLMGDNLNDLSNLFEKRSPDDRSTQADDFSGDFGNHLIVLPNPVYGDWESALYNYNYSLSPAQKDSVLKAALKTY